MPWNLTGSYVETCSCELMCPCNLSLDHGATYDFCRVTLVFNIREGQIEGTDIGGLKVAAIADTPKVMTEGNWRLGVFIDAQATPDGFDLNRAETKLSERISDALHQRLTEGIREKIGETIPTARLEFPAEQHELADVQAAWVGTLEPIYPTK